MRASRLLVMHLIQAPEYEPGKSITTARDRQLVVRRTGTMHLEFPSPLLSF